MLQQQLLMSTDSVQGTATLGGEGIPLDGIYFMEKLAPSAPTVLYMDCSGWWTKLSHLYFSRRGQKSWLVSRHADGVTEEIIGRYCPQCFSRYTSDDASSNRNACTSCFQCPYCSSPLVPVALSERNCAFQCGYCSWRSDSVGLTASDKKELEALCLEKEREIIHSFDSNFALLLKNNNGGFNSIPKTVSRDKFKRFEETVGAVETKRSSRWTIDDMNRKLAQTAEADYSENILDSVRTEGLQVVYSAQDAISVESLNSATISQILQNVYSQSRSERIMPVRTQLRSKRTLRSRKDVYQGRMNILVQPKPGPLEGDSSQKTLKGNWWVKDSSAVHEIPSISVIQLPTFAQLFSKINEIAYVKILVLNPKDVDMVVSMKVVPRLSNSGASVSEDAYFPSQQLHLLSKFEPYVASNVNELAAPVGTQCRFTLAAYEDDLLKDSFEDKAVNNRTGSSVVEESLNSQHTSTAVPDVPLAEWLVSADHNIAIVSIPVARQTAAAIITSNNAADEAMCDINLQIHLVKAVAERDQSDPVDLFAKIIFLCS